MATLAGARRARARTETFWLNSAIAMTALIVLGFSTQLAMGRSSFRVPIYVHLHALAFFGWTALYLVQTIYADTASMATHRRLGWLAVGWIPAMVATGILVTVLSVREGRAPFFFTPGYFLVMNPFWLLTFAGLAGAAIVARRRTQWHRRLMVCAMAILTGPALGRLLPLPLVIPYAAWVLFPATLLFPAAGAIRDRRRSGRVHPAWWCGIAVLCAAQASIGLLAAGPAGAFLYRVATAGSAGAEMPPRAYPPPPWGRHRG